MKGLVLLAALALGACIDPRPPLATDFGNAVNSNIAAQVVNPVPAMPGPNGSDGRRMDGAVDRYVNDKVYRPQLPLENGSVYVQSSQQQPQ